MNNNKQEDLEFLFENQLTYFHLLLYLLLFAIVVIIENVYIIKYLFKNHNT